MTTPTRRQCLILAGGAVTTGLAGCIEDDSDDGGDTPTGVSSVEVQASEYDTTLTLIIRSRDLDFESVIVDVDRVEFIGQGGTDDATVEIGDTGLDLTEMPDDGKTYLYKEPFPSGTYAEIELYITVQENTHSNGESQTFDYELPLLDEDTKEISDTAIGRLRYSLAARSSFDEDTYSLDLGGKVADGGE